MKVIRTLHAVVIALAVVAEASAADTPEAPGCLDTAIAAVQKRYEEISDLSARFEQRSRSVALGGSSAGAETVSRGTVVFAKPGKMRWAYEEPEPSLVVSDGETLWLYDPAHSEVQRMSVSGGFASGAAIQFLLGQGDMRRDFDVRALACEAGTAELELLPKSHATYEKLHVLADVASGQLRRTTIFDLVGNVTQVEFRDVLTNQAPGEESFRFDPPKGVEVIDFDAP